MIHARHPVVANLLVRHLEGDSRSPSLRAANQAATELDGLQGFAVPSLSDVAEEETNFGHPDLTNFGSGVSWPQKVGPRLMPTLANSDFGQPHLN